MAEKPLKSLKFHGLDDIYKIPSTAEDVGAATLEQVNEAMRKAAPRNLLDNSDFTNPVNQRGQTSYSNGYTIDRWLSTNANVNVIVDVDDGKITLSKSKTGGTFCQYLPFDVTGKRLTLAINTSIGLLLHSFVSDGDDLPKIEGLSAYFGVKVSNGITQVLIYFNNSDTIEFDLYWAALYEGEYTIDTLPEYQPKGYGAELTECQRYYYQSWDGTISNSGLISRIAGNNRRLGSVEFPVEMRITPPTIILYNSITGTANTICVLATGAPVGNMSVDWNGRKGFTPTNTNNEFTAGTFYAFHYMASADLL